MNTIEKNTAINDGGKYEEIKSSNLADDFFKNQQAGEKDDEYKFKFETLGGDASLLHLAS